MNDEARIQEMIESVMTPEEMKEISIMIQRMSMMIGFLNCGTTNKELLCAQVYLDKMGMIPSEAIEEVYDDHLEDMMGTEFIVEKGELMIDPELLPTVLLYKAQLDESPAPSGVTIN